MTLDEFIRTDNRFADSNEFYREVKRLWNRTRAGELSCELADKTVTVLALLLDWMDEEVEQNADD